MILFKYLIRELLHTLLAIVMVLLVVILSVTLVKYLSQTASGSLPLSSVISLIGIELPRFLAMLLPISFFLSIVLTYGKLFANSELLVMFSCGLSWWRLALYTLVPGLILAVLVGFLSCYVTPLMSYYRDNLLAISSAKANTLSLAATGRFLSLGNKVVYINHSHGGTSRNLFIYQKQAHDKTRIILSPKGYMQPNREGKAKSLVLQDGRVYEAKIGEKNYQLLSFKQYQANLTHSLYSVSHQNTASMSTVALLQHPGVRQLTQFQWRLALPITVLIVGLLGVAICGVGPRKGRYSKLINAILLFIIYFNLITVVRSWMSQGEWPLGLGLWSIEIVFALYAVSKLSYLDGWIKLKKLRLRHVET